MIHYQQLWRKSITRRFMSMMLIFLFLLIAGASIVLYMNYNAFSQYQTTIKNSMEKQKLIDQLVDHTSLIFFRARGYYAFLSESEYIELYNEKRQVEELIHSFNQLPLNTQEAAMVQQIETFVDHFFTHIFPTASGYAKAGDYESLRKLSASGINEEVNDLIRYASAYQIQSQQLLTDQNRTLFANLSQQSSWFLLYIVLVLIIAIYVAHRTTRDIGVPLGRISAQAERFAQGETVHLQDLDRTDEIGTLARSLDYSMRQIQAKEEVLVAQNEELQAQQDELMMQQEDLQDALAKMEAKERYLQKRNQIIQSLSNTLNKRELLHSIVINTTQVMNADKGIVVLLNDEYDSATLGLSAESFASFREGFEHGPLVRLQETGMPYLLTRESTISERSFYEGHSMTAELYVPVLNAADQVVACIVFARIDRTFSPQDIETATGLAKQISLSLDKLAMYEEAEKQRQMTQDMLDTIQEGVQLIDLQGNTLQVNRTFCEFLGYDLSSTMPHTQLEDFLAQLEMLTEDHERVTEFIKAAVRNEGKRPASSFVFAITYPHRRQIQLYAEPLYRNQEKWSTLLVYRDITREYEIDRMKSEFVSTVSHELRTPLASVLGFAELMLNKALKPERQQRYVSAIYQEAKRLTALINDFLDLQRMESGLQNYLKEPIAIDSLVQEVFALYQVQSTRHSFTLDLQTPQVVVEGDRNKLRQVMTNLISNAVKYSPHGGEVRVTCRADGDRFLIDVADEGLGIPADALPHLFTKFYRVDNSDRREIGGTGLGLAIVAEIVAMHQGEITVTSESGRGSTFTVSLPHFKQPTTQQSDSLGSEVSLPGTQEKGQVVIIEDDPNLSELLREELIGSGFTVHSYSQVNQALGAIEELMPDAVVLDLVLKDGENGWEVIERMQKQPQLRTIPIIISSAFEEQKKAFDLGAARYLIKPYHPDSLSKAILLAIADAEAGGQILIPDHEQEESRGE